MIDNVKISLVYHFYCSDEQSIAIGSGGNIYNEINRRCLSHFCEIFDNSIFCICVDDTGNSKLIEKAVEWVLSCGFKKM